MQADEVSLVEACLSGGYAGHSPIGSYGILHWTSSRLEKYGEAMARAPGDNSGHGCRHLCIWLFDVCRIWWVTAGLRLQPRNVRFPFGAVSDLFFSDCARFRPMVLHCCVTCFGLATHNILPYGLDILTSLERALSVPHSVRLFLLSLLIP